MPSRVFLGTFIDSMAVDDGEITFNYGLSPDGAEQETVSVPGIVPSGPLYTLFRKSYVTFPTLQ